MRYIGRIQSVSFDACRAPSPLGFTDSDWVGNSIDHKSTSGYSLSLGFGFIC
jgi:hypothetical protein